MSMNLSEVGQQLANILNKSSNLFFKAGDDFARELTLGQVIKGKVLRSYDGGRYEVEFSGQQKTVDSAVPLKAGEMIQGRVVNVGDKVEIKRLAVNSGNVQQNIIAGKNEAGLSLTGKWESMLLQAMRDFNVKFNAQQRSEIVKAMKQVDNPHLVLLSATALIKQNVGINQDLLLILNKIQNKQESLSLYHAEQVSPKLAVDEVVNETLSDQSGFQQIASAISLLMKDQENKARNTASDNRQIESVETDSGGSEESSVAVNIEQDNEFSEWNQSFTNMWRLLNNQVDGSIQHRISTLPIWIEDKLVEVDVAMYEQQHQNRQASEISSKKIIFSLQLENLGHVDVEMLINNKHIKMSISTDAQENTQNLLSHGVELGESISEQNWSLDEMSYVTKNKDDMGHIVSSVLEHYASQDSLSRLM